MMDTEVREAEPAHEDSAYVRSYLRGAGRGSAARPRMGTPGRGWPNCPTPTSSTSTTPTPLTRSTNTTSTHMPGPTRPRRCCTADWWLSNRSWRWHSAPGCSSRSTSCGGGTTLWRWSCRCWSFSAWWRG
ncbi:putative conserved transmembrane protein [Mycobacterium xenopi 4042]|uniref:Putative conserved transmembrane protein n=1 Tax=Mycobacterium xenopi 4042 TaxID=1299334 RepID=X8DKU7_MYCXE|nr:putative conserved transmembrane protein [Mycobacterium xenopi 4042]